MLLMSILKTLTIINNYPTQYLFVSSPYYCQFGHAATPESECKCHIDDTVTQLWNMNKMVLARRGPKMPQGWALIYGCSIAISPYQILLIGGHYTMMGSSYTSFIPINNSSNDRVIEYDFKNNTWTNLALIPFEENGDEYKLSCALNHTKSNEKYYLHNFNIFMKYCTLLVFSFRLIMVIGYSIHGLTNQVGLIYNVKDNAWTKSHFLINQQSEDDGNDQLYVINMLQKFYVLRTICYGTNHSIEVYHYKAKSNSWKFLYSKSLPICDLYDLRLI